MLGSAAAFVAVTNARAADAVVAAEPEPMEYVRICDTYGVGFYYIPGTETCLKLSGYLRYDVGAGAFGLTDITIKKNHSDPLPTGQPQRHLRQARALSTACGCPCGDRAWYVERLRRDQFRMANRRNRLNFYYDDNRFTTAGDDWSVEHAYIELAGFRVGMTDSLFSTFTGYAGGVINDDIIGYGPYDTHQIAYGWASDNGFGFAVALEEGGGGEIAPFVPRICRRTRPIRAGQLRAACRRRRRMAGRLGRRLPGRRLRLGLGAGRHQGTCGLLPHRQVVAFRNGRFGII